MVPRSFQSKSYPKFIRKSKALKALPKPDKIFPLIGLKNHKLALSKTKLAHPFGKGHTLYFSSTGTKGYWDIATMSMRGVNSCMNWEDYKEDDDCDDNCLALVGSLVDPYVAVIYVSDGSKTKYGKRIVARCVVRFVVDAKSKPHIFLEPLYRVWIDTSFNSPEFQNATNRLFVEYIKSRTRLPVVCAGVDDRRSYGEAAAQYRMPLTKAHARLDGDEYSYTDCGLPCVEANDTRFYNPNKLKSLLKGTAK
jgi:hypothetical protein